MFVDQRKFSKLLQDNEGFVFWKSSSAPECHVVHEWRLIEGGRCLLREYQRIDGSIYWANAELLERLKK